MRPQKIKTHTRPVGDPPKIAVYCAHNRLVDAAELVPNPRNPNSHPTAQIELLAKIIKLQGWRAPIVVSNRSGFVVAGHGRLAAGLLFGGGGLPVNFQNFESGAAELAHLLADNRIPELADLNRRSSQRC